MTCDTWQELAPGLRMLDSTALSTIFAGVNDTQGLDDDSHELTFDEFYVAMCLVAVYCNRPMDAIVFPGTLKGEVLRKKNDPGQKPEEMALAGQLTSMMKQVSCGSVRVAWGQSECSF